MVVFEYFSEHALTYWCFEFFEQVRVRSFGTVFGARKCDSLRGLWKITGPKTGPPESAKWVDTFHFSSKIKDFEDFQGFQIAATEWQ